MVTRTGLVAMISRTGLVATVSREGLVAITHTGLVTTASRMGLVAISHTSLVATVSRAGLVGHGIFHRSRGQFQTSTAHLANHLTGCQARSTCRQVLGWGADEVPRTRRGK